MKLSEVSREQLSDYLRLDDPEPEEQKEIDIAMQAAKAYIKSYTGLTEEEMDKHPDITTAYMVIVADSLKTVHCTLIIRIRRSTIVLTRYLACIQQI